MADTKIIVTSSDSNNSITQKTIPNINPDASSTALKTFGQKLTALTDNTYVKTDRIDKTNCDSAVAKLTPSLIITDDIPDGLVRSWCLEGRAIKVSYTGDGELYIVNNDNTTWATTFRTGATGQLNLYIGVINSQTADNATAPHDIVVRSVETDTYAAGEWTFQIIEG